MSDDLSPSLFSAPGLNALFTVFTDPRPNNWRMVSLLMYSWWLCVDCMPRTSTLTTALTFSKLSKSTPCTVPFMACVV